MKCGAKVAFSLFLVCFMTISAIADGPTQNEETTKNEADLAESVCWTAEATYDSDTVVAHKEMALEVRTACVLAGKTTEEMAAGQALYDAGSAAMSSAVQNYGLGTNILVEATLDKATGDDLWNGGHYASACTWYVGTNGYSYQLHLNATPYFTVAGTKTTEAADAYCNATNEWTYLLYSPP